eukprot:5672106-Amphidinium_carterae.2
MPAEHQVPADVIQQWCIWAYEKSVKDGFSPRSSRLPQITGESIQTISMAGAEMETMVVNQNLPTAIVQGVPLADMPTPKAIAIASRPQIIAPDPAIGNRRL